ncbi:MAG: metallophosphoesterase [Flavobacteriales bacterium]|nr:metallophosphoesterase [Flavobacteriales bacterium]
MNRSHWFLFPNRELLFLLLCLSSLGASAKIDYVRVMFNRNGSNSATIGWNQLSGDEVKLYYSKSDFKAEDYAKCESSAEITTTNMFKGMNNHFVRLKDLPADAACYFVVVDSEGPSERYWFKTTPASSSERLSIIAGGDSRSRRKTRVSANKLVAKLLPHAVIFAGDYTDIDNETKWHGWFEDWEYTYSENDNRIIPLITARGNHEKSNEVLIKFFDCPSEKNYYSVELGGDLINVITLNTENLLFGGKQKSFLEETLQEHSNFYWNIPQYHRSCRPHVKWKMKMRGPKQIYRQWIKILEKYGVQLVIECDTHIAKITWPIVKASGKKGEDGFVRDDVNGIVYAGEGCWGAPLREVDNARSWTRAADGVNSFKWIWVDRESIEMRTVDYINEANVNKLTEESRFTLPKNIKIWKMGEDEVVHIKNKNESLSK